MTHSAPMPDSAGEFSVKGQEGRFCKHCKMTIPHTVESWDSSCGGYTDYKYTCTVCGHGFWIDGIDS